jgi:hypothetical protein
MPIDPVSQTLGRLEALVTSMERTMTGMETRIVGEIDELRKDVGYCQRDIKNVDDKIGRVQNATEKAHVYIEEIKKDFYGDKETDTKGVKTIVGEHEVIRNKWLGIGFVLSLLLSAIGAFIWNVAWPIAQKLLFGEGSNVGP